jgi:G3E family GTPase
LPLTVIGGFLGAGKTTLLNHWLRHAGGQRLAVLVNDFGALNIDAELIVSSRGDTIALSNGCVCCQIGDDLSAALIRVLESADRFDAVVIEASGVSDPWRIAQLGRADPGLGLDGVVVLVDAGSAWAHARDPRLTDTLERQLKAADLVVLNKCDTLAGDELARVRDWVSGVAGAVPQFETTRAQVPLPMLTGLAMPSPAAQICDPGLVHGMHGHEHEHEHEHEHAGRHLHDPASPDHGAIFDTWSCRTDRAFDVEALRRWLNDAPVGLLRLKGVLRTADAQGRHGWAELQFAGRRGSLRVAAEPRSGPAIVAIALRGDLPLDALNRYFVQ